MIIDRCLCHSTRTRRCHELITPRPSRAGHHQIQSCVGSWRSSLGGSPVRHQQAVPTPFGLEDAAVQLILLGCRDPVDVVVGGHDRPGVRIGHADLEWQQIELAERGLGNPHVHCAPLGFRLVCDKVLHTRSNPVALDAPDVGSGQPATQQRIFGICLKQPATQRRAVQIDRRAEDHIDGLGATFAGEHLADPLCSRLIP